MRGGPRTRWFLLLLLAAAIVTFALYGRHWLDFAAFRAAQGRLQDWVQGQPLAAAALYFAVYAAVGAFMVPGVGVLSIVGGALFGLWWGSALALTASLVGAAIALLIARHLLREPLRRRYAAAFSVVDRGIAGDGAFYLAALRLVPGLPFFVINPVMGLTAMPVGRFVGVSAVSMVPGTLLHVNAGTQVARLASPADVLSWPLVLSLLALALLPFVARRAVTAWQQRRALRRWAHLKPPRFDRNLVVVGGGAAGLVAASLAAATRARVTLVESGRMGGDCLHTGCVPSKALLRVAAEVQAARRAGAAPEVDFARVMARVADAVRALAPHDSPERFRSLGVEVIEGRATLVDPWHVRVEGADGTAQVLSTRAVVLSTGARPVLPDLPGLAEAGALTSETLWSLQTLPRDLVVLGGGAMGCELAQAFARLGSRTVLVERAGRLLPQEEPEAGALLQRALQAEGVQVLTGRRALRCEGAVLVVDGAGREERLPFDRLLCATGRRARVEGFGLEALGLVDGDTLAVDEWQRTRLPHILAAGDLAGPWQLTNAAAHQGWHAAANALLAPLWRLRADRRVLPRCTFTDPEVARVGLTVEEARAGGQAVEVTAVDLTLLDRAAAEGRGAGWAQVLTPPGSDRILGATVVGAAAGETIAVFALAMRQRIGLRRILSTVHAYPTFAEAAPRVALAWRRAHAPRVLLAWAERWHRWRRGA